jgi:predicted ester cyclase
MSEENKSLARNFVEEVWNAGNLSFIDDNFAEEFIPHFVPPNVPKTPEGFKGYIAMWRSAFPDIHIHTNEIVADNDKVAFHWSAHATHKGAFMGIQPSGKEVGFTGMSLFRLNGSKFVEAWAVADQYGALVQIGAVTPPGQR